MRWTLAMLTGYLLALGFFTAYGFRSISTETDKRCEAFIRGYELLGDELDADPEQVERFVARLQEETDC